MTYDTTRVTGDPKLHKVQNLFLENNFCKIMFFATNFEWKLGDRNKAGNNHSFTGRGHLFYVRVASDESEPGVWEEQLLREIYDLGIKLNIIQKFSV